MTVVFVKQATVEELMHTSQLCGCVVHESSSTFSLEIYIYRERERERKEKCERE